MLSPPLSILDSTLYDLGCDDTHTRSSRSRAGTTNDDSGRVELQRYLDSPRSSPSLTSHSTSTASSSYLSPLSSSFLPTPAPAFTPFPELSPELLKGEWSEKDTRIRESPEPYDCAQAGSALPEASAVAMRYVLRRVSRRSASHFSYEHRSCVHLVSNTLGSAAALSLDSSFSMSSRDSFPWPHMMGHADGSPNLLGHDLAMGPGSDGGYASTGGSRSAHDSPPRQPLSAEQRELKRQMDQARRESKSATRFRRSSSNPYLADTTTAINIPAYTSSTPPISLLAEPATTSVPGQNYLSPYSQPLQESDSAGVPGVAHMYGHSMPQQSMYVRSPELEVLWKETGANANQAPSIQRSYGIPTTIPTTSKSLLFVSPDASPSATKTVPLTPTSRPRPSSISVGSEPSPLLYSIPNVMTPPSHSQPLPSPDQHHVRMVQGRPKPQCWEHGCNGRQFSTFSNLLRHQREKSGQASKASCPNCGAEFTRTTARNGHLLQGKCKRRGEEEEGEGHMREA